MRQGQADSEKTLGGGGGGWYSRGVLNTVKIVDMCMIRQVGLLQIEIQVWKKCLQNPDPMLPDSSLSSNRLALNHFLNYKKCTMAAQLAS